jgi:glutaredoxin
MNKECECFAHGADECSCGVVMITLYSNGCSLCNTVTKSLDAAGISYGLHKITPDDAAWLAARGHRSMPVMVKGEWEWGGHDCLEAIAGGELE